MFESWLFSVRKLTLPNSEFSALTFFHFAICFDQTRLFEQLSNGEKWLHGTEILIVDTLYTNASARKILVSWAKRFARFTARKLTSEFSVLTFYHFELCFDQTRQLKWLSNGEKWLQGTEILITDTLDTAVMVYKFSASSAKRFGEFSDPKLTLPNSSLWLFSTFFFFIKLAYSNGFRTAKNNCICLKF